MHSVVYDLIASCENGDDDVVVLGSGSCAGEVIGAVTAVGGWFGVKAGALSLGAKASALAVAAAAGTSVLAAVGAGAAVAFLVACVM